MAMTLRLTDAQTEAEHRSMQQVALAAIDLYVQQPIPHRRAEVPVSELMWVFAELPPLDATAFRADVDRDLDRPQAPRPGGRPDDRQRGGRQQAARVHHEPQ